MLNAGDLLIALNRPLLNRQIKAAILSNSDLPAILYQRVGKFVFRGYAVVDPKFFLCYLRSMSFINQLEANMQGSDQPFINKSQLMQFGMPFPPIKEQHRIVAKVDELMALCDQLEAQLTTTQTDSRRLLEAVLEAALAPV
jgi:type I restriction enzyme S subunit